VKTEIPDDNADCSCVGRYGKERHLILGKGDHYYSYYWKTDEWKKHAIPLESSWNTVNVKQVRFAGGVGNLDDVVYIISSVEYDDGSIGGALHKTSPSSPELDTLVTEFDFLTQMGGNPSVYGDSLWIPTTGAYGGAQRGTVDDVIVLEWDGNTMTTHRVGSPNGSGFETISWADNDYLYLLETSRGEIWRWNGSAWTYLMRLYNEYTSGNEVRGHVAPVFRGEHAQRVSGWIIAHDNKLWYFEPPGKIRKLIQITQPIQSVEPWQGGVLYGTEEGGSLGMDQIAFGRWGQARAWLNFISASDLSKVLADNPVHFSDRLWDNTGISAGDSTPPIPCWGYDKVAITFTSDTAGTLTINGDTFGSSLREYDTVSISANTPEFYIMTAPLARFQLSFDSTATVTAEVNMR